MRVRVKTKISKRGDTNGEEFTKLLSQLDDKEDSDVKYIGPICAKLRNALYDAFEVLRILHQFPLIAATFPAHKVDFDRLGKFIAGFEKHKILKKVDEKEIMSLPKEDVNIIFRKLRDSLESKLLINTCSVLAPHKEALEKKPVDDSFIPKSVDFIPMKYFPVDFKIIWCLDETPDIKKIKEILLLVIRKLKDHTNTVYEMVVSPTVDKDLLCDEFLRHIVAMRKDIPRCDDAFGMIERSGKTLKAKFNEYYKQAFEANNRNLVWEFFLKDLLQGDAAKKSPKVRFQLRRIVNHITKQAEKYKNEKIATTSKFLRNLMDKASDDPDADPEPEEAEPKPEEPEPLEEFDDPEPEAASEPEPEPEVPKPE